MRRSPSSTPPAKRVKLESRSPIIQEQNHESDTKHSNIKEESECASLDDAEMAHSASDHESEENNCSICLQPIDDRTVVPTCSHEFCFECLLVWTEQSRRCPLCSQNIGKYVIHNIRSRYDYRKHYLNPLRKSPPPVQSQWNSSVSHDRVRRAARQRRREREWGRSERAEREEADRLELSIQKRRWVYQHHLYAKHVASNAYTKYRPYPNPSQFAASPELISRTTSFFRRELQVWEGLDIEFLTTLIISLMKSIDIRSESAVKLLAEFLDMGQPEGMQPNAEHFAHEVYCYVRSPYRDLFVYDTVVQYDSSESQDVPPSPIIRRRAHRWHEPAFSPSRSRSQSRSPQVGGPRHHPDSPSPSRKPSPPPHSSRLRNETNTRYHEDSRRRRLSRSRSRSRSMSWSPSGRTYLSARERAAYPRTSASGGVVGSAHRRGIGTGAGGSRSRSGDRSRPRHKRGDSPDHTALRKRGFPQDHEAPKRNGMDLGVSKASECDADEHEEEEGADGNDDAILAAGRRGETSAHRRRDDRTPRASTSNNETLSATLFEGDLKIKGKGKLSVVDDDDVNVLKHRTSVSETEVEPRQSQAAHLVLPEKLDGGSVPSGAPNTGVVAASTHAGTSSISVFRPPRNRNLRDSVQAHLGGSGFSGRVQRESRVSQLPSKRKPMRTDTLPSSRRQAQCATIVEPAGASSSGPSLLARLSEPVASSSTTSLDVGTDAGAGNCTQGRGLIHITSSSSQEVVSILSEPSCQDEAPSSSDNHLTLQTQLIIPKNLHHRASRDRDVDANYAPLHDPQSREAQLQRQLSSSSTPSFGHQDSLEGRSLSTLSRSIFNDDSNRSLVEDDSSQATPTIDSVYTPDSKRHSSTFVTHDCAVPGGAGLAQIVSDEGRWCLSPPAKQGAQATRTTSVPARGVVAHHAHQRSRASVSVRSDSIPDISSVPMAELHHVGSAAHLSTPSYPIRRDVPPSKSVSISDQSHKNGIGAAGIQYKVDVRTLLVARLKEEREKAEVFAGSSGVKEETHSTTARPRNLKPAVLTSNLNMAGEVDEAYSARFEAIRGSKPLRDISGRTLDPSWNSDIVAADSRVMEANLRTRAQLRVRLAAEKQAGGFA